MDMEPKILSNKLDEIQAAELGISVDSAKIWDQLESRLENQHTSRRFLIAASVAFLVLLFPLSFLKQTKSPQALVEKSVPDMVPLAQETQIELPVVKESKRARTQIIVLDRVTVAPNIAALQTSAELVNATPLNLPQPRRFIRNTFSNKDISVIQASLGEPGTETGRKVTVRAQLYPSSENLQISNGELKIKLNAKNK